ncbi:hypothetical protein HBI81_246010 [Parastagonospora nodorum]|nr:hypothetical protein HBH46_219950 [Parastagonospora nodorum]KAH5711451.1 hypothetical protein HBI18_219790 [Parastagonospora nodorum]KAH6080513.1 hypothetical protein HBI65_216290 [Parastagonospora nodorum]KAH6511051.1 hypothetical protein HBI81_246010 [Parastagonospora nodorum]
MAVRLVDRRSSAARPNGLPPKAAPSTSRTHRQLEHAIVTAFKDIEPRILNVADRHSLDLTDSTAYATRQTVARNRGSRSTRPGSAAAGTPERAWYMKHELQAGAESRGAAGQEQRQGQEGLGHLRDSADRHKGNPASADANSCAADSDDDFKDTDTLVVGSTVMDTGSL